ncbi:MAG: hypothetical protein SGJ20_22365 [Planctomycetota bacterium]|nr:hypothetical protein [Planctomycetota bacterium]
MQPQEFAEGLRRATPSLEKMRAAGESQFAIDYWSRKYQAFPRDTPLRIPAGVNKDDPVISLISNWDLSQIEVGDFTFSAEIKRSQYGVLVGHDESAPIYLSPSDGSLMEREPGIESHILCQVAKNSGAYLDVMYEYATCIARRVLEKDNPNEEEERERVAARCIELAGGEEYTTFCRGLFGI